jgi:hypothetical protein
MIRPILKQLSLVLIVSFFAAVTGYASGSKSPASAHLYRYKDADGNVHLGRQIPPENYRYGYTALDEFGDVIEVVPPAPTAEERAAYEEELRLKEQQSSKRLRDEQLMKAYSSASGAENARDRKIAQIDVMIDITRAKLAAMRVNYDREVEYAADMERAGKTPDRITLKNISDIEESMIKMEFEISEKEHEKEEVRAEFSPIVDRLKTIEAERAADAVSGDQSGVY